MIQKLQDYRVEHGREYGAAAIAIFGSGNHPPLRWAHSQIQRPGGGSFNFQDGSSMQSLLQGWRPG